MEKEFMTYEEIAKKANEISWELWALYKQAQRFENCRVMSLTASILRASSDMLQEAYDNLTSD